LVAAAYHWSIIHYQNPTPASVFKVDSMFVSRLHNLEIVSPDKRRLGEILKPLFSANPLPPLQSLENIREFL
jgi:hypothetical protein